MAVVPCSFELLAPETGSRASNFYLSDVSSILHIALAGISDTIASGYHN